MSGSRRSEQDIATVCPKTGKPVGARPTPRWMVWLFPVVGLLALIWFLVRLIPKPSRAAYPCQRVAASLASSFLAGLLGLGGAFLAFRKARQRLGERRDRAWRVILQ